MGCLHSIIAQFTCTQVGDSYSCACTEDYQGRNCDRLITSTTTSTSTTTATSGTTEDREGPTGAPQPPFANISVQDFFGQSCELRFEIILTGNESFKTNFSEEGKKMMEGWIESYRKWEILFADYQETY